MFEIPPAPAKGSGEGKKAVFKLRCKSVVERETKYKQDKAKVFDMVMSLCSRVMEDKVRSFEEFKKLEEEDDVAGLFKIMEDLIFNADSQEDRMMRQQAALRNVMNAVQDPKKSLVRHGENFMRQWEMGKQACGFLIPTVYVIEFLQTMTKSEELGESEEPDLVQELISVMEKELEVLEKQFAALVFLAGVDRSKYGKALDDLKNDYLKGDSHYPDDIPGVIKMLTNYRSGKQAEREFDQMMDGVANISLLQRKGLMCWLCGEEGHMAPECPKNARKSISGKTDTKKKKMKAFNGKTKWNQSEDSSTEESNLQSYDSDSSAQQEEESDSNDDDDQMQSFQFSTSFFKDSDEEEK